MSGVKAYSMAGATPAAVAGVASAAGIILTTGVVVVGGVAVAMMAANAVQAYQERSRKEREAAEQKEREIQQRIAQIRARVGSRSGQAKVKVKLPDSQRVSPVASVQAAAQKDTQKRVQQMKSRLPSIQSEYQALVDGQLLDAETVQQALRLTEQALNSHNLEAAEAQLQALDNARIQVMQEKREQLLPHFDYVQERLEALRSYLPDTVAREVQVKIEQARNNLQQVKDADIEALHQLLSEYEVQVQRIQEAAENLVNSWTQVGYVAHYAGIDNGDAVIEVETHEGVNTQMRVQFDGQEIDLFGPPEETHSCALRTKEALQIFQEQGYYLEWSTLDGEAVPEEWRQFYSAVPASEAVEEVVETYTQPTSQRRLETQGY